MADRTLLLSLACNDERGYFASEVCALEISEPHDEPLLAWSIMDDVPLRREGGALVFEFAADDTFTVEVSNWRHHVGNIMWDDAQISETQARELALWLRERVGDPDQWVPDDPLGKLGE